MRSTAGRRVLGRVLVIQTFERRSHCHCATVVYITLLPVNDHLLPHLNAVITSVPSAEQQSLYERSAQVSSLLSFSHSGNVRSPFGIRRIVIPRPHKNQNARTSPVPRPTETRPRGLLVDQAIAHKKRAEHKVNL